MSQNAELWKHEKGPDHLIIDNFLEISENIDIEGLRGCRREAQSIVETTCSQEPKLGARATLKKDYTIKCDALIWLNELIKKEQKDESNKELQNLGQAIDNFKQMVIEL